MISSQGQILLPFPPVHCTPLFWHPLSFTSPLTRHGFTCKSVVFHVCGLQGFGPPPPYSEAQYGQQPYPMTQPYPMQPGTVTVQPTVYVARRTLAQPVNDYMGYSIFTMLCCCLPLGIAALIYSISVSLIHSYLHSPSILLETPN
uniref:Si:ch73-343g19.4 n=1 Tax=Lates calcarifer TaxID=8187 RepID=A0A4W6EEI7_LATCA